MLHMPGVVHSSPPFPADTFQMAKTDDYFHCEYLIVIIYLLISPFIASAGNKSENVAITTGRGGGGGLLEDVHGHLVFS